MQKLSGKGFFLSAVIAASFLLALSCASKNEAKPEEHNLNKLNSLITGELQSKRIVMLGDGYHAHHSYSDVLIGYLNEWVDSVSANPSFEPKKLILVLEMDTRMDSVLNNYIITGDMQSLQEYFIPLPYAGGAWERFSIYWFRLYTKLRAIKERINKLRENGSEADLIITGFEENDENIPRRGEDDNEDKNFLWFAHVRDRNLAKNAKAYLDSHPGYKALFHYGTAHLLREFTDKGQSIGHQSVNIEKDYFLAHYLDQTYGRDNVSVFNTERVFDRKLERIIKPERTDTSSDYFYYVETRPFNPFPFYFLTVKSKLTSLLNLAKARHMENNRQYIPYINTLTIFLIRSYIYEDDKYTGILKRIQSQMFEYKNDPSLYDKNVKILAGLINEFDDIRNIREMDKWILKTDMGDGVIYTPALIMVMNSARFFSKDSITIEDIYKSDNNRIVTGGPLTNEEINFIKANINSIKLQTAAAYLGSTLIDEDSLNAYLSEPQNLTQALEWRKAFTGK